MKKLCAASAIGLLTLTFAGAAAAEPVAEGLAIGVERVFGLVIASDTAEGDGGSTTSSNTSISLGFSPLDGLATSYSAPRVGLDYIMPTGLSFGGGLGYTSVSNSTEIEFDGDSDETDNGSVSALLLAPRVGYLLGIGDGIGIWPRGGITYVSVSTSPGDDDTDIETSGSRTAFTIEAPLVAMAGPVGFLIAPTLDIGLSGSEEVDGDEADADFSATEFGIQFGIMGVI